MRTFESLSMASCDAWQPEAAPFGCSIGAREKAAYCVGLENVGIPESRLHEPSHVRLVESVFTSGTSSAIQPRWTSRVNQEGAESNRLVGAALPRQACLADESGD